MEDKMGEWEWGAEYPPYWKSVARQREGSVKQQ